MLWSKFLARKVKLEDLQPYVVLRGSLLSSEEKKKVILESDQSLEGKLTIQRVTEEVRVLGASFFSDMTGQKKTQRSKVYEQSTLVAQDQDDVQVQETAYQADDVSENVFLEAMQGEGDEDATLIADFEQAAAETLQEDPELASAYTAYQDARRRLSEKFRNRGFWPTSRFSSSSKGKGYGHGAKSSSKGKGGGFPDRPPALTAGTDHVHQLQSLWKARSLEGRMSIQEHSSSRCWNILHQYNIGEHADYHSDRG